MSAPHTIIADDTDTPTLADVAATYAYLREHNVATYIGSTPTGPMFVEWTDSTGTPRRIVEGLPLPAPTGPPVMDSETGKSAPPHPVASVDVTGTLIDLSGVAATLPTSDVPFTSPDLS